MLVSGLEAANFLLKIFALIYIVTLCIVYLRWFSIYSETLNKYARLTTPMLPQAGDKEELA
jgi:hypothetical protein